jgi:hypothetical protein
MVRLQRAAEPRGFNRREPVMSVVQQVDIGAELGPETREEGRYGVQITFAAPARFRHRTAFRRLVAIAPPDAVGVGQPRHAALRAHRLVAARDIAGGRFDGRVNRFAARVAVDHD